MRLIVASALALSGCATSEAYVAGTPAPWEQSCRVPIPPPPGNVTSPPAGYAVPQPAGPAVVSHRSSGGFWEWFKSGRGVTGAKRDLGLDRMMVDTLTSGSPGYGQESVANPGGPGNDSWIYPGLAPTRSQTQTAR